MLARNLLRPYTATLALRSAVSSRSFCSDQVIGTTEESKRTDVNVGTEARYSKADHMEIMKEKKEGSDADVESEDLGQHDFPLANKPVEEE